MVISPEKPVYDKPEVVEQDLQISKADDTNHANKEKTEIIYSFSNVYGMALHNLTPERRDRIIHSQTNPNGTVSPLTDDKNIETIYSYTNVGQNRYETDAIEKPTRVSEGSENLTNRFDTNLGKSTYHEVQRSSRGILKEDLGKVCVESLEGVVEAGITLEASSIEIGLTEEQFSDIYQENIPRLVNYLVKRLGAPIEDAKNSAYEALVIGWKNYSRFEGRSKISTWLTTIARNEYLMLLRKRKSSVNSNTAPLEDHGDAYTPDQSQAIDSELLREEAMEKILEGLKEKEKEVFKLLQRDYDVAEIPGKLNITYAAAKGRIYHARRNAKRIIKEELGITVQDLF